MNDRPTASRRGSVMIESPVILLLLCIIVFGSLQVAHLFAARDIMDHAAFSVARARAVGFNSFMIRKVGRVAMIPNAGRMTAPEIEREPGAAQSIARASAGEAWDRALRSRPTSPQAAVEAARIPLYLLAGHAGDLPATLDYEDWDATQGRAQAGVAGLIRGRTQQEYPLRFPFHRVFYAADEVSLSGEARLADHARLYLQ